MWWHKHVGLGLRLGSALWQRGRKRWSETQIAVVVPAVLEDPLGEESLYSRLGGVPVVARTLLALDQMPLVREVVVVTREAELMRMADLCREFDIQRVRKVICAREPGLGALLAGVLECEGRTEYIGIHDPLRPFATEEVFRRAVATAEKHGAGIPAVAVKDTVKVVREGVVQETPNRSKLHLLQTPQVVESNLLKAALCLAEKRSAAPADLPAALELLGLSLRLAEGSDENMRVSTEADFLAAETILRNEDNG